MNKYLEITNPNMSSGRRCVKCEGLIFKIDDVENTATCANCGHIHRMV